MGGFSGLNLPQQVAAPQGVQGGVIGPNPSALNRDPRADQVVKGVSQLMQGLVSTKQAVEQHYGQKVDDLALRSANGLITPDQIDWKQVASWMKKSGRAYNTDQTPAELNQSQALAQQQQFQNTLGQAQQNAQALASQSSGMPVQAPGPMGSPGQPGVPAPGVVAPPSPPVGAAPGFMDRLRLLMGMQPQNQNVASPSPMSPAVMQMRALAQAGQTGGGAPGQIARGLQDSILASNVQRAAGQLGIAHNQSMIPVYQGVFQKALNGDVNAMTMLRRLDVFKGVPIDEVASLYKAENPVGGDAEANNAAAKLLLWQQGGGPQLQLKIADLAKDMIPRFGGDASAAMHYTMGLYSGQPTGLQPGMTPDEFSKFSEGANKVAERYPAAPQGLVDMYANAKVTGHTDLASSVLDFLSSHYKSTGQISQSQFQQSLSKDYSQIASQNQYQSRMADSEGLRVYSDAIDKLVKDSGYEDILKNPGNYTQAQKDDAANRVNDLVNSLAGTTVTMNGVQRPLAPLQELTNRNNVQNSAWSFLPGIASQGPYRQGKMLPSFQPSTAQPNVTQTGGKNLGVTPQDMQLLGLPQNYYSSPLQTQTLQQLLMQRAQ